MRDGAPGAWGASRQVSVSDDGINGDVGGHRRRFRYRCGCGGIFRMRGEDRHGDGNGSDDENGKVEAR